jgi:hypothetical protein
MRRSIFEQSDFILQIPLNIYVAVMNDRCGGVVSIPHLFSAELPEGEIVCWKFSVFTGIECVATLFHLRKQCSVEL